MLLFQAVGQNSLNSFWPRLFQRTCGNSRTSATFQYWVLSERNEISNFGTFAACLSRVAQESVENAPQDRDLALAKLKSEIKSKRLRFETIKQATVPGLTENYAAFLISLCGKPLGITKTRISLRNEQAKNIFQAASAKSVRLFNQVLQVYIENENLVDSSSILNEMKKLKLEPNKDTFAKLIALHCLAGDVDGAKAIVEFAKLQNLNLPGEIHGYLAYSLSISGLPIDGLKYINEQISSGATLSWDEVTRLLMGLVQSKSFDLYHTAIHDFGSYSSTSCSIDNILKLYLQLVKFNCEKEIVPMFQHYKVSEKDIMYACGFLKDYFVSLKHSAYFLNFLLEQYEGLLKLNKDALEPAKVIMKDVVCSHTSLDEIYDKMKTVTSYYPSSQVVIFLTLVELAECCPLLVRNFLRKLFDNQLHLKPPNNLIRKVVNDQNALKSFANVHNLYKKESSLEIPIYKLKLALSSNYLHQASVEIFDGFSPATHSSGDPFHLISFAFFLEKHGVTGWNCSKLQTLLHHSSPVGLKNNHKLINDVRLLVGVEADFLFEEFTTAAKDLTMTNSRHSWQYIKSMNSRVFTKKICRLNSKGSFDLHAAAHALTDFVVDEQFKRPENLFNALKLYSKFPSFHEQVLPAVNNLLFCSLIEQGLVKEAEALVTKGAVNLDIEMLPSSLIKSASQSTMKFLIQHLVEKQSYENAIWILFTSFVKADMIAEARKIVRNVSTINIKVESWLNFLDILSDETNFIEKVVVMGFLCQGLQNFDREKMHIAAVKLLLKNGRIDEARNWTKSDSWTKLSWSVKATVAHLFFKINEIPGRNVLPHYYRLFVKAITEKNFDVEKVLTHLKRLQSNYPDLWKAALRTLLAELYKNIPLEKFAGTTTQIQEIIPDFNPNFVSSILIDQVERLAQNDGANRAVQFAIKNLSESTKDNCETWSTVVRICCDAAIKNDDFLTLERIYHFSERAVPQVKIVTTSYLLYSRLRSNQEMIELSDDMPLCLAELVKLIASNEDKNALLELHKILLSSHPEHLEQFFASALQFHLNVRHVRKLFQEQQFSLTSLNNVADLCYLNTTNYKECRRIDNFFRRFNKRDLGWQANLNTKLYSKFCNTFKTSSFDQRMVDYLVEMYHKVPSRQNSLYTRTVYIDLLTNVKYCSAARNKLCVYY